MVKRKKSSPPAPPKPRQVIVMKRLGLAAEVIPYQASLLFSNQYSGRREEKRLVGESDLVAVTDTAGIMGDSSSKVQPGDSGHLPSTVLLQRVRVTPAGRSKDVAVKGLEVQGLLKRGDTKINRRSRKEIMGRRKKMFRRKKKKKVKVKEI